jgi:hypothetical protein
MSDNKKNKKNPQKALSTEESKQILETLKEYWDISGPLYRRELLKMDALDKTNNGQIWQTTGTTYPEYQILPDTNHVSYIRSNLLASIYSVSKSANVLPTSENDKELCVQINIALQNIWSVCKVGFFQFQAGDRAALLNLGITQVGYDRNKDNPVLKNINPMKFRRDPYAIDLENSAWCCTFDHFHRSVFTKNPDYAEAFKAYEAAHKDGNTTPIDTNGPDNISKTSAKGYYTLFKWWIRNDDGTISEYHTINNDVVVYYIEDIKPSAYPFALLYCNLPSEALIGTSEPAKIFANSLAYNIMDSLALTSEYKNQRPPKFVNKQTGLNIQAFSKHGDDADRTFVVLGDATKAVHYHQFPQPSNFLTTLKMALTSDIQNISGVDGRYTGRDTGSIITTGGTEEMLNRVTVIDTPKITLYEDYCKQLTQLILGNMIEFSDRRSYFRKKPNTQEYEVVVVDFPDISSDTLFNYEIEISSDLPRNRQRIAAAATMLLEKAQYRQSGGQIDWITEEDC